MKAFYRGNTERTRIERGLLGDGIGLMWFRVSSAGHRREREPRNFAAETLRKGTK
jgi:hypothetical protein